MNNQLKDEIETKKHLYNRLAENICEALKTYFSDEGISYLSISHRIKSFESFSEKVSRKVYKNPFEDIEDICGIRVIAYFPDDVIRIDKLIRKEFNVFESEVKGDQLKNDQFGYRSDHFVVSIKNSWLSTPNYRGLNNIKTEIQVRTILMHAWADLSHKLAYKTKESTPSQFLRNIYQLSALFELADERFEDLRKQKEEHIKDIVESANLKPAKGFPLDSELNVDTLQAYLNFRFPNREGTGDDEDQLSDMIEEMDNCDISLEKLDTYYKRCEPYIEKMETLTIKECGVPFKKWAQLGMVRMILDHLDDKYMELRNNNPDSKIHIEIMRMIEST